MCPFKRNTAFGFNSPCFPSYTYLQPQWNHPHRQDWLFLHLIDGWWLRTRMWRFQVWGQWNKIFVEAFPVAGQPMPTSSKEFDFEAFCLSSFMFSLFLISSWLPAKGASCEVSCQTGATCNKTTVVVNRRFVAAIGSEKSWKSQDSISPHSWISLYHQPLCPQEKISHASCLHSLLINVNKQDLTCAVEEKFIRTSMFPNHSQHLLGKQNFVFKTWQGKYATFQSKTHKLWAGEFIWTTLRMTGKHTHI